MKRYVLLPLLGVLVAAASLVSSPASAQNKCLNIFDVAPLGPFAGGTFQLNDNTIIQLGLAPFWNISPPPDTFFNSAEVMEEADCFGGPAAVFLNNVNLVISFIQRENTASHINVNYCDFGGFENVSVGFGGPAQFVDEIDNINGMALIDPFGDPVAMSLSAGQREGKLVFEGKNQLSSVVVGGQELFIHSICLND